jgi:uncharacterized membrane protein affecting hemolysin expression
MAPISYFNRVKIISLMEMMMCQKLRWRSSWDFQQVDKTKQIEFIRGYARFTLDTALSIVSKNDLDDQNLLLATVLASLNCILFCIIILYNWQ